MTKYSYIFDVDTYPVAWRFNSNDCLLSDQEKASIILFNEPQSQRLSFELRDQPDPQAAERIALLHKKGTSIDALSPQQRPWPIGTPLAESAMSRNPDCIKALLDAGASKDAPAFTPKYALKDPEVKGQTVREHVLKSAEIHPTLYSDAVLQLFK